ncbi:MAG: hypothetical protein ACOCWL_02305 [Thermoguttaceae bacterium]
MRRRNLGLSLVLLMACVGPAAGQAPGTAVQLPTFSQFGVGTTVSVPDRGSGFMGGISRSSSGRNSFRSPLLPFRPFKNTAVGSQSGAMNMHVSAWIHDFEAMDEYLLSQPPRTVQAGPGPWRPAAGLARSEPTSLDPAWNAGGGASRVARTRQSDRQWEAAPEAKAAAPLLNVDDEQQRRKAQAENRSAEAEAFFVRGQEAEAAGKANVARIYYQMVARRATGNLQREVLARLRALSEAETAGAVARSGD